jgi:hypothetical protein
MAQDILRAKISLLEELIKQKISQANALKDSLKPIEAFSTATKEMSKKIEEIITPKKQESLDLLSKAKMTGESYRFLIEILDQLTGLIRHSKLDTEKMLLSKQYELNFISQEYSKLKEQYEKLLAELNKPEQSASAEKVEKTEEVKAEFVRPDQNPNTRIGKAAIDLQQRKKGNRPQDEAD